MQDALIMNDIKQDFDDLLPLDQKAHLPYSVHLDTFIYYKQCFMHYFVI